MVLWIVLGLVVVLAVFLIGIYNGLVKARVRVNEAWSDITVQLKRRFDLIPNLVSTVKGYAKHEEKVFEEVTKARSAVMSAAEAGDAKKTAENENMFASTLKSLFAVAEAYPDLKADKNFQQLQADLTDTENKIQASRRFYNGAVRDFNTKVQVFPTNLIAGIFGFKSRDFFEVENQDQVEAAPEVNF
jgi:LemA protein